MIYSYFINTWMFLVVVVGVCIIIFDIIYKLKNPKENSLENSLLKKYHLIEMHLFSSGRALFQTLYFLCPVLTII